jgi:hypothetical protein
VVTVTRRVNIAASSQGVATSRKEKRTRPYLRATRPDFVRACPPGSQERQSAKRAASLVFQRTMTREMADCFQFELERDREGP